MRGLAETWMVHRKVFTAAAYIPTDTSAVYPSDLETMVQRYRQVTKYGWHPTWDEKVRGF